MYPAPPGYLDNFRSDEDRTASIILSFGYGIDMTAWQDFTGVTGSLLPLSQDNQLGDSVYNLTDKWATFEGDGIDTSGDSIIAPIAKVTPAYVKQIGVWSDAISDGTGAMSWTFAINLSSAHTCALTVYTDGPSIQSATVKLYDGANVVYDGVMICHSDKVEIQEVHTWDKAEITVTQISQPYRHVRVAEIAFGTMKSISNAMLTDTVDIIEERDVLMQTIPLSELSFSVVNVEGEWDVDNPDSLYNMIPMGGTIMADLRMVIDAHTYMIPFGRFIVTEKKAEEDALRFTAFDFRHGLTQTEGRMSLHDNVSVGSAISSVLSNLEIPHKVASDAYDIYPATMTMDEPTMLDCLIYIQQKYDVWVTPLRDGYLNVTVGAPTGEYGIMPMGMNMDYPRIVESVKYNFISVAYGTSGDVYEVDLRPVESEIIKSVLSIRNPLIATQAEAQVLANKMAGLIHDAETEIETLADGLIDLGDKVGVFGRWSVSPSYSRVTYIETTFDGAVTTLFRAVPEGGGE